jgi:uncharacterized protein involved in outer membrane biogenesis
MGADLSSQASGWRGRVDPARVRKWAIVLVLILAAYAAIGFLAIPALVLKPAERSLSSALKRPVSIDALAFNPFTLKARVQQLHIGEPGGQGAFVDVGQLGLRLSWLSLLRLKPIIGELTVEQPNLHLVRTAAQHFNFSDLLAHPDKPAATPGKPLRFAVHNIRISGGSIDFDDRLLGQHHRLEHLELGVPFIANLPSKADTFVQPTLSATLDGSAFSIGGRTQPFSLTRQSEIGIRFERLALPPLLAYSPTPLPVSFASGWLSSDLKLRFRLEQAAPVVEVAGTVDVGDLDIKDSTGKTLLQTQQLHLAADSLQPLRSVYHIAELRIEQPLVNLQRDASGVLVLPHLQAAANAPASPAPAAPASPAPATPTPPAAPALDATLKHLVLNGGAVNYQDFQLGHPASLALEQIAIELNDFSTTAETAAQYKLQSSLKQGGTIAASGSLKLKMSTLDGSITVQGLNLPPLQPFLNGVLAAKLRSGALDASASMALDWSKSPLAIKLAPAHLELRQLKVLASGTEPVIGLDRGTVDVDQLDLGTRQASLPSILLDGLAVHAQRSTQGAINLAALVRTAPAPGAARMPPVHAKETPVPAAAWHYKLDKLTLRKAALTFTDDAHPEAVVHLKPMDLSIQDIGDDFSKPWRILGTGTINEDGHFQVKGTLTPTPLKLSLHVDARHIDVAPYQAYATSQLNATIGTAWVGVNGVVELSQGKTGLSGHFTGDAGISRMALLDKLTADNFATWGTLNVAQIDAAFGGPTPARLHIGAINLSDFYARILLDSQGKLNLSKLVRHEDAPVQSLTRADTTAVAATPVAAPAPAADAPRIEIGAINLHNGGINYTDDFIKPNFSASLSSINGQVGTIGSQVTVPAPLQLRAELESSGPVAIDGSVNPLAKPPFLDLTASAHGITLTNFSTYSEKYVGYRILKGTLSVDLHYKLDHGALTANNHLFVDQFTFGDKVDSPSATSLPVRLALGLLKDSRGQIDVDLPVSGSLSDPQFSVSGLIWRAVRNLLEKAVSSPFSLLANAFGGGSEELGYVAFEPGSAHIGADQGAKLETLQKALANRPGVNLDVAGRIDPSADRAGLKQLTVERQIKRQRAEDLSEKEATIDVDSVVVPPDQYQKYLERAYSAAKFAKPKNFIGLSKSLPPDQMRNLMVDNAPAGDAELLALAQRRAAAVQAWFAGKLPPGRVYVVSPKLDTADVRDSGPRTRADFAVH